MATTTPVVDPNPPGYVDKTHLQSASFGKPFILTKVFDLLIDMINVLQLTAAAQANRLNFFTEWQKAYTDELNQIHSFTEGNSDQSDLRFNNTTLGGNKINDGSTVSANIRAGLNALNSTFTQQIQGNLNLISNDAKALQANVNQSNDAVQQQADMATGILQQMSTILTAIYSSA